MELTPMQSDVIREIANIGSGHAATSLSMLLDRKINISVPKVWLVSYEEIASIVGQIESPQAAVYVRAEGEAPGKAIYFFPLESAHNMVQSVMKTSEPANLFSSEMAQSALMEIGNILVSSFLIALTNFSKILLQPSVPALAVDMVGAIMDAILLEDGILEEKVLFIETKLSGTPEISGQFIYLPDEGSLNKLLGAFGV